MSDLKGNWYVKGDHAEKCICLYKYASFNSSVGARFLRWVISLMIDYIPKSIPPNFITVINILIMLSIFVCFLLTHPNFDSEEDYNWLYFIMGLDFIFYQYLDCLDGGQARRLDSENAMGEILDHGVDQLSVAPSAFIGITLMKGGQSFFTIFTAFLLSSMCVIVTWDSMLTGFLKQGQLSSGVEFHAVYAAGGCFICAIFGRWLSDIELPIPFVTIRLKYFITVFFLVSVIVTLLKNFSLLRKNPRKRIRKELPVKPAVLSFLPIIYIMVNFWVFVVYKFEFCKRNVMLVCCLYIFLCIHFQCLCIVAKICHTLPNPFHYWVIIVFPIFFIVTKLVYGDLGGDNLYFPLLVYLIITILAVFHVLHFSMLEVRRIMKAGFWEIKKKEEVRKLYTK